MPTGRELLTQAERTGKPVKIGSYWWKFGGEIPISKVDKLIEGREVKYLGKTPEDASANLSK